MHDRNPEGTMVPLIIKLCELIIKSFDDVDFAMIMYASTRDFDYTGLPGTFKGKVFETVKWAYQFGGADHVLWLAEAVAAKRPLREEFKELVVDIKAAVNFSTGQLPFDLEAINAAASIIRGDQTASSPNVETSPSSSATGLSPIGSSAPNADISNEEGSAKVRGNSELEDRLTESCPLAEQSRIRKLAILPKQDRESSNGFPSNSRQNAEITARTS